MPYYVIFECDYCDHQIASARIEANVQSVEIALAQLRREKEHMTRNPELYEQRDGTIRCDDCRRRGREKPR